MESLNWKFRKSLESMNSYNDSKYFKNQIEKSNKQILNLVIREIEIILTEPHEQPFAKFLSIRFCKEILLFGNPLVITHLQRIVSILIKICSYKLESKDPNRGVTFFQTHPVYLKAKPQQKENLKLLGSSFLIICLQSIKIWGTWIPYNQNGTQSVFKKAYDNLVERGVSFGGQCQYYKKTDEQKFNKTYKVQFFQTSDILDDQSQYQNSMLSDEFQTLQQYKSQLTKILEQNEQNFGELEIVKAKIYKFYNNSTQSVRSKISNSKNQYERKRYMQLIYRQKAWCEKFLENYKFLITKKINYNDFKKLYLKNLNSTQKKLEHNSNIGLQQSEQKKSIKLQVEEFVVNNSANNVNKLLNAMQNSKKDEKQNLSKKKSINENLNNNKQSQITVLKQQKSQFANKINELEILLNNKTQQLKIIKIESSKRQEKIRNQYEQRIKSIKQKVIQNKKSENSIYQTKQLLDKIKYFTTENDKLKIENQKLIKNNQNQEKNPQFKKFQQQFKLLENKHKIQLDNKNSIIQSMNRQYKKLQESINAYRYQIETQKSIHSKLQGQYNSLSRKYTQSKDNEAKIQIENQKLLSQKLKIQKEKLNLTQQLNLYKSQLNQIRNKNILIKEKESDNKDQIIQKNKSEIQQLKIKINELIRLNQSKDSEILKLTLRNRTIQAQSKKKDINFSPHQSFENPVRTLQNFYPKGGKQRSMDKPVEFTKSPFKITNEKMNTSQIIPMMKEYSEFFNKVSKQLYLRFCKSALKQKDLLFKQNQFEIGLITQKISSNKIKLIIHFTNNSGFSIKDFKIKTFSPKSIKTTIINEEIKLIQPGQQQKCQINHQILTYPIRKINIEVTFQKNHKKETINLLLPVLIIKYCDFFKPTQYPEKVVQSRQFKFSNKIVQNGKNLITYFSQIRQVIPNSVYDIEVNHRQSELMFFLKIIMNKDYMILEAHCKELTNNQKEILNQVMNTLQFVFMK